jgi:hypothetical protein
VSAFTTAKLQVDAVLSCSRCGARLRSWTAVWVARDPADRRRDPVCPDRCLDQWLEECAAELNEGQRRRRGAPHQRPVWSEHDRRAWLQRVQQRAARTAIAEVT